MFQRWHDLLRSSGRPGQREIKRWRYGTIPSLNYRANGKRKLVFNKTWLRTDIKTILPT